MLTLWGAVRQRWRVWLCGSGGHVLLVAPRGRVFNQKCARCGRYVGPNEGYRIKYPGIGRW